MPFYIGRGAAMRQKQSRREIYSMLSLAARRAYARGIQTGSGGNLSARDTRARQMIVKASGGSFADCTGKGAGFVVTRLNGERIRPDDPKPSREAPLHGMLYEYLPAIGGVMHCHSPWAVAFSFGHDVLPMTTWHVRLKLGCDVPILNIDSPILLPEHMSAVRALFEAHPDLAAFILRGHGVVAFGRDVLEAEHTAELIEETAQIAFLRLYMGQSSRSGTNTDEA